jgi:malate dehydrogenase
MDPNNYYLCRHIGLEPHQCIGFGGQLDSSRFGLYLEEQGISGTPWVIGEHGEYQVPLFSRFNPVVPKETRESILARLRSSSMEIIKGKGGTVFGPAYHIAELIRIISRDERKLITCSCVLSGEYGFSDISIGVPAVVGREGVREIREWELDDWEKEHFTASGNFVAGLCGQLEF